jgi:hypothetical protein
LLDFNAPGRNACRMVARTAALLLVLTLSAPALADDYPVQGRWGVSGFTSKGPIDCTGKRVIDFRGNQRTDTGGGVPRYRNKSATSDGSSGFRIVDQFSNGQVHAGTTTYQLRQSDEDHVTLDMRMGGTLKLARCK